MIFRLIATLICLVCAALPAVSETRVPKSQTEITLSFAPLVRMAAPAVVNIYAKRVVAARRSPFAGDPFFEDFFRNFAPEQPRVQNSLGSGVILSGEGLVVSNYHVVGQATDIRVVLNDRREFSATVLMADKNSDLAILKLDDAQNMPHLPLRDSDNVEVGELVLAIGNPFGVGQTVSSGIVSGLARSGITQRGGYFIQTDAPINPGNSGGALIDMQGRLVGVNTSILTRSGGSNGVGFAIPASLVAQFMQQAKQGVEVFSRPWAGMVGQAVDADLAGSLGLGIPRGVAIVQMHDLSPFAEAGLKVGDVITHVDGAEVNTPQEMLYRMSVKGVGAEMSVIMLRNGKSDTTNVVLVAPPDFPSRDTLVLGKTGVLTGMELARINPAVAAELGLPMGHSGVVVVDPGKIGARVGFSRGDVIETIGRRGIETPKDVAKIFGRAKGNVSVQIRRGTARRLLRFRI